MTQLPAHLQNRQPRGLAQRGLANVGSGTPAYLSIEGGKYTLIDAAGNMQPSVLTIDVVIMDINDHVSKIWYGANYDPNNPSPPRCWSDNGIAPSRSASEPQSPTCGGCSNNVWGSKISALGSKVKECADQQKVAIVVPGMGDLFFQLRIPPGSFKNWRDYLNKFAGQAFELDAVVTRLGFEPKGIGLMTFQATGFVDEAQIAIVDKLLLAKATDGLVGRTDQPRDPALAANPLAAAPLSAAAALMHQPVPGSAADVPNAAFQSTSTAPASTQTGAPAQAASRSEPEPTQEPARRGRRRQTAEAPAPQQATQAAPQQAQMAPFRPEAAQQAPFGMAAGAAPNAELQATLNSVFGTR